MILPYQILISRRKILRLKTFNEILKDKENKDNQNENDNQDNSDNENMDEELKFFISSVVIYKRFESFLNLSLSFPNHCLLL